MSQELKIISLASDHAGLALKNVIMRHLCERGIKSIDVGAYSIERTDYNEYCEAACRKVLSGEADAAILVCGTGIGMSVTANKIRGIRCAAVSDPYTAAMSKRHNNSNALALGGRVVGYELAFMIVDSWLDSTYEPRHQPRLDKIADLEERERRP